MRKSLLALLLILSACSPQVAAETSPPETTAPTTTTTPQVATTSVATTAAPVTTPPPTTTTPPPPATTTTTKAPQFEPVPTEMFAWMPGGLTEGFPEVVAAVPGVVSTSVITSVTMHLVSSHLADGTVVDQPRAGYVIPLHAAIVDADALDRVYGLPPVGADEVILGEESAALRRLGEGDTITFEKGVTLTVGAVVVENLMAGYEAIATTKDHFVEERMQARAMLVLYHGNAYRLDLEIRPRVEEDLVYAVRERTNSADRGGLVVRSQVFIKQNFGEFAYRTTGGGRFVIDPAWVAANIVETNIPLLGRTKCHRVMTEILTDIMQDLVDNGLSNVIDQSAYAGCWNARYIASSARLSRHSFGAAADINIFNPTDGGPGSPVHEELLSRIYAAGLTSGHVWRNADPGHFEFFNVVESE